MRRHPVLGTIAVVPRGGHVLLVRRGRPPDAGLWGFPGGHVEWGETALEAAERELLEETGVVARALRYLTNIDVLLRDGDGTTEAHYLLTAVLCEYREGEPRAADDAADARWVGFAEVEAGALPTSLRVGDVLALARREIARG